MKEWNVFLVKISQGCLIEFDFEKDPKYVGLKMNLGKIVLQKNKDFAKRTDTAANYLNYLNQIWWNIHLNIFIQFTGFFL